ncbi:MAG: copper-translocating P-type ATPase [Candidatus Aquicultor secundus]|uniref:Copper-translocating P-type ATPase n=1 Tax=Candidatus Aquicultor secundus TaxID=1973895 RepID=A0A2M7T620_9ACTN|nr:heavy metal translocating P-type ATPase [Candidatus Aquicultor secundus]OIO84453.1 MAG: copper-translocating P-type ATPase [Candidatus Aquicultor secundus]PIU27754.1 MAG: copper-translocating P-type ATPase [Candidatus Aquicultor secundus]PIW22380.1 MAG: copper-translocating P-type ATPase [Candidatus Aquicultor secundus]PIX51671.1 MAG: copper-translocating P-type ATPase [Candidatus Aquicultor secundus]PIY39812.1 MAG: copper-translocating P-type ATPase [Candidatus Aquicultor secundus]
MRNSTNERRAGAQAQPNIDYAAREEKNKVSPAWQSVYEFKTEYVVDMPEMARRFRNAFVVTLILALAIIVTSPANRPFIGFVVTPPIGENFLHLMLAAIAILYGGRFFYTSAWLALRRGATNAALLVTLAVLVAYAYGIVASFTIPGTIFFEIATVVLAVILVGHWMEILVWERITEPVQSLYNALPELANVVTDEGVETVPIQKVHAGDTIVIRAGDTIPADGIIVDGYGLLDESVVTGNPEPVEKDLKDDVLAATVNQVDEFTMKAIRAGDSTVISQMITVAENAQRTRAPLQQTMETVVSYFIPLVIIIATLAAVLWGFVGDKGLVFALIIALATLVVAGPDALALAVPTAILVGAGIGLRRGILIKNAAVLEKAAIIDTVVFGKTGCLTEGNPRVSDIYHVGKLTEAGFLRLAAGLEKGSKSDIARAIVAAAEEQVSIAIPTAEEHRQMPGYGTVGKIETRTILVGNKRLMAEKDINTVLVEQKADELAKQGKTIVYAAVDGKIEGIIGIYDPIRSSSAEAVKKLRDAGINVTLITDDNYTTAKAIADDVGIDKVYAEVPVAAKADIINELQHKGRHVAAVSASSNDASTLGQADIGIAFAFGANLASEPGQVVLIKNDPIDVVTTLELGKDVAAKIRWNLILAIAYNVVALPVAAGALYVVSGVVVRPEVAAVVVSLSTLAVMANSLQLRQARARSIAES